MARSRELGNKASVSTKSERLSASQELPSYMFFVNSALVTQAVTRFNFVREMHDLTGSASNTAVWNVMLFQL